MGSTSFSILEVFIPKYGALRLIVAGASLRVIVPGLETHFSVKNATLVWKMHMHQISIKVQVHIITMHKALFLRK